MLSHRHLLYSPETIRIRKLRSCVFASNNILLRQLIKRHLCSDLVMRRFLNDISTDCCCVFDNIYPISTDWYCVFHYISYIYWLLYPIATDCCVFHYISSIHWLVLCPSLQASWLVLPNGSPMNNNVCQPLGGLLPLFVMTPRRHGCHVRLSYTTCHLYAMPSSLKSW